MHKVQNMNKFICNSAAHVNYLTQKLDWVGKRRTRVCMGRESPLHGEGGGSGSC